MKSRDDCINERLSNIPPAYRRVYFEATKGNSLRASVNSGCLECVGYHIADIQACTDLGCSYYAVRPYISRKTSTKDDLEEQGLY